MNSNDSHPEEETRYGTDPAAESTHYPMKEVVSGESASGESKRAPEAFFPSTKSLRLTARPNRGSLATKFAVPIILALVVGLIALIFLIRNRVAVVQREDLKRDAADTAFTTAMLGRVFFTLHTDFLVQNPTYFDSSEWLAGDHWLVRNHLIREEDWINATGFDINEYAPIETLQLAREHNALRDMAGWLNTTSDMVAVYLLDSKGYVFARAESDTFRLDPRALRALPVPRDEGKINGISLVVDYIAAAEPEPLVRGVAQIYSRNNPDTHLGTAVVIFRTGHYYGPAQALLVMLLISSVIFTAIMAVVAWYSAGRVTSPIRRLAADMQAMAEGDYTRRSGLADSDEVGMLAQAFNSMAERLRVARANEKENSRLESDLTLARNIQNNLLPLQTPRVRGLDIHTIYRPAREIGGDYFDFLPVDNQHMGIVVADASGKSIPAALVMSTTRAILRFVAPGNNSAAETLTRVNAILSVDIPKGMFVTAYYVILDPLNNQMLCASAGHTPLLIARADGSVELMNPGGIALGFDNGPIFQRSIREQRVKLEKGDRVILYTDGVVECVNPANEEYSDRRLREFLRRNRELTSHDFVGALLADLDRHRGTAEMRDDTTVVTFKVL